MAAYDASLQVVPASSDSDLARITRLAQRIWQQHYLGLISQAQIDYMLASGYAPARLAWEVRALGVTFWLARIGDEAVGFAAAGPDENAPGFWLHKLYVDADHRQRGAARALVRAAEQAGRAVGAREIQLRVNRGNALALAAYARLGYKKSRCDVKDIGNGFVMDDYLLSKSLAGTPG